VLSACSVSSRRPSRRPSSLCRAGGLSLARASRASGGHTAASEAAYLRARIEDLQRQLGRLEGRLELAQHTESTLREDLERERRQRLEEVQRERDERLEAQKTAEALERDRIRLERERFFWEARQKELEEALEAERSKEQSKSFWVRLFGG
jgi:TolA-binding protein